MNRLLKRMGTENKIMNDEKICKKESKEYLLSNSIVQEIERKMIEGYTSSEEFKDRIYELMNGSYDLENCDFPEKMIIKDEFAEGSYCAQEYEEIYAAKQRLCERLGVESDQDIELIIFKMQNISQHLSMRMYDYGRYFSFLAKR